MSGLFRRLAQQASGRATMLHAPARLPFHGAPAATGALDIADTEMIAEAPSPIVAMPAQPRSNPPHVSAKPEPFENAPATTDAAPGASAVPATREAAKAASSFELRGEDMRHESTERPANPARADQPARRARTSVGARDVPLPIVPRIAAEEPLPRTLGTADSVSGTAPPLTATTPIAGAATPEFPPTLLPPQTDASRANTVATNARPQTAKPNDLRAQMAATDSPNEVHVHIGRIEVTAIQEPAPKPRAKRNGHAPMSLDEYVAKRRQGSS